MAWFVRQTHESNENIHSDFASVGRNEAASEDFLSALHLRSPKIVANAAYLVPFADTCNAITAIRKNRILVRWE